MKAECAFVDVYALCRNADASPLLYLQGQKTQSDS